MHLAWRRHLTALASVSAALLLLFLTEAAELASFWWNSSTFNHCLLIPPLIGWLVAQRWPELRRIVPQAWAPGLLLVAAGAAGWMVGEAGGIALARHAGLLLMLQGTVVALLGKAVARGLIFPLSYALFLLPIGEELVPTMQTLTARMTMVLLGASGVPAHLEGIFITTPVGYFEVAEACSGVRFLVAMAAFGVLVANVGFRSWPRRLVFLTAALALPILANGVRAWGTIYAAQQAGIEFAAGFDHVVYGWVFFAIVIALLLAVGWRFFDRRPDDPWLAPASLLQGQAGRLGAIAAAALVLAALPLGWSAWSAAAGVRPLPTELALPEVAGWPKAGEPRGWRPEFAGAELVRRGRYRDGRGREVDVALAVYGRQDDGHDLVGAGQGEAPGWAWIGDAAAPLAGRAERVASHGVVREVVSFYRVGEVLTGSVMGVKLETMRMRLLGGPRRGVALLVSARAPAAGVSARPAIDDFLAALGPVERLADRAAGED